VIQRVRTHILLPGVVDMRTLIVLGMHKVINRGEMLVGENLIGALPQPLDEGHLRSQVETFSLDRSGMRSVRVA